jgi:hypothetical protein
VDARGRGGEAYRR